jgi:hypothetical protein
MLGVEMILEALLGLYLLIGFFGHLWSMFIFFDMERIHGDIEPGGTDDGEPPTWVSVFGLLYAFICVTWPIVVIWWLIVKGLHYFGS